MVTKEARSLLVTSTAHGVMHGYLVVLPALLPLVRGDIGDYRILGWLVSIVFVLYGWGALPVGLAADRFSKKTLIVLSMTLCGVASILIGFSQDVLSLAISLALLGIGASLYHPTGFSLISLLSQRFRGRYMGVHGVGGNAGMALAYVTSGALGVLFGWRGAFLAWGFVGIATGLLALIILVEPERLVEGKVDAFRKPSLRLQKELFTPKNVVVFGLLALIIIFSGILWDGVSAFLVAYITEVKGTELLLAGGLVTVSYLVGSLAQIVGGELSDRMGRGLVLLLGLGSYSLALLVFTLPYVNSPLIIALMVSLLGFTFFVTQAPLGALLGDLSPARTMGLTYGLNFAVKYGIGGIAPAIAGYIAERYTMDATFYFFAAISALSFVAAVPLYLLRENRQKGQIPK